MSAGFGLCGACQREIPLKYDGRLRAHLAGTSRPGHRQQCDGSGAWSATQSDLPPITRPAAFNAREEWAKVIALNAELQDMCELGAASYPALVSARDAVNRALDDAGELAPWWAVAVATDEGQAL
jgi:hypothetical protein